MSNPSLPPKPDFPVDYSAPRSPDHRRPSAMTHPAPRRSPPPRERDRYPRSPPPRYARGPPPTLRSSDTYIPGGRDREDDRFRDSYRGRDYDRRDRDREYVPGLAEPRHRRDDSWEPGERREREVESRRRYDDDDRRGYRREPVRAAGDTRPWPRARARYGRDYERPRFDPGPDSDRRRRSSRSPPRPRRFERSPSSRARSPPTLRRRSASPPSRHMTRTSSPEARSSARAPPQGKLQSESRPSDAVARDIAAPESSRKRFKSRTRSRSRSSSVRKRKQGSRSPSRTPENGELPEAADQVRKAEGVTPKAQDVAPKVDDAEPEVDKARAIDYVAITIEDVAPKPEDVPSRSKDVPRPNDLHESEYPLRAGSLSPQSHSPAPSAVTSLKQVPPPVPKIETDMDADPSFIISPADALSARTEYSSPASASLPPKPRSPPTGPRSYVKTPTGMQSPQQPSPVAASRSPINLDSNGPPPSIPNVRPHRFLAGPSERSKSFLPPIDWKVPFKDGKLDLQKDPEALKKSKLSERELELARLRTVRTRFVKEYTAIARSEARISHELALSTLELQLAESRRIVADAQLDKARAGALGIDYAAPRADDLNLDLTT